MIEKTDLFNQRLQEWCRLCAETSNSESQSPATALHYPFVFRKGFKGRRDDRPKVGSNFLKWREISNIRNYRNWKMILISF